MADSPEPDPKAQELVQKVTPLLRPEKRGEGERVIHTIMEKLHQGPLPAPEDLAHYNDVLPGAAERIVAMAEKNQHHRQAMEERQQKGNVLVALQSQWFAILALFAMLSVVGWAVYMHEPWVAGLLGGGTIAAVVGMFLNREPPQKPPTKPQAKQQRRRK